MSSLYFATGHVGDKANIRKDIILDNQMIRWDKTWPFLCCKKNIFSPNSYIHIAVQRDLLYVGLFRVGGKMYGVKYREIMEENLLQAANDWRLGCHNDPRPVSKATAHCYDQSIFTYVNGPVRSRPKSN